MDVESYWRVIGSERRSLAELLESLADEQWETPSLCAGWRVRDVAAHVALVPTGSPQPISIGGSGPASRSAATSALSCSC